jgi:ribose transport system substrate-binding protein
MKPLRTFAFLTACVTLGLSLGCTGGSGKPRVAFVSNNPETFWTIAEAGCRKGEKEFDVEVLFRKPSSGDPAKQTEILDILANQKVKAIAVSVIDPKGQRKHLDEIVAKGIPLITQDNDAPDTKRLCYIGTDNYKAGRAVGKLVMEAMPDGGTIAVFVGDDKPLNARQRRQGVLDELAGKPEPKNTAEFTPSPDGETFGKYKLSATYTDQPDGAAKAVQNANTAVGQLKNEKNLCFIGLWAYNPPAIVTAVRDGVRNGVIQKGQVRIVGFDEEPATLDAIGEGLVHATVVQDPFNFGYEAVRIMASLAKGDRSVIPEGGMFPVPHRVITKDGGEGRVPVKEFRDQLNKLLGM